MKENYMNLIFIIILLILLYAFDFITLFNIIIGALSLTFIIGIILEEIKKEDR